MGNFTTVPDVTVGESFPPSLWESVIMNNLNLGVTRQLADTTLAASAATVSFTSIPATFAHLLVVIFARGDLAAATIGVNLSFNGDAGSDYWWDTLYTGGGTSITADESSAQTSAQVATVPAASAPANSFGGFVLVIPNYAETSNHQPAFSLGFARYAASSPGQYLQTFGLLWDQVAAVSQVTLLPSGGNFVTGSRFTLYGLPA